MVSALAFLLAFLPHIAAATEILKVHSPGDGIWAIEGPAVQRDVDNLGNNATSATMQLSA